METMSDAHKILLENPEGKRQLRRSKLTWEHNIKTDLRETGREEVA
jgi:hypothetical protein